MMKSLLKCFSSVVATTAFFFRHDFVVTSSKRFKILIAVGKIAKIGADHDR